MSGKRFFSTALKKKMEVKIAEKKELLKKFKAEHGNAKVGEITVG